DHTTAFRSGRSGGASSLGSAGKLEDGLRHLSWVAGVERVRRTAYFLQMAVRQTFHKGLGGRVAENSAVGWVRLEHQHGLLNARRLERPCREHGFERAITGLAEQLRQTFGQEGATARVAT